jgi:hypothetical protein
MEPTQPPVRCVPVFSRGYCGRGVALTTHTHVAPRLKSRAIPVLPYMSLWRGQKQLYRFVPKILCLNYYLFMSFLTRLNLYQGRIEQTRNHSWTLWTWIWKSKSIRSLRNYWLIDTVSHRRRQIFSYTSVRAWSRAVFWNKMFIIQTGL